MPKNIRLHKSGRFEARIQIAGVPWSAYGDTPDEAALALEEKLLRSQNLRGSYTLRQWMEERYLPSIEATSKAHQTKAKWAIKELGRAADLPIKEVDRNRLQLLVNQKAKTLTHESLRTLRSVWSAALNLAEADDIIAKNPLRFVRLPRAKPAVKPVLNAEELRTLIDHTRGYAGHGAAVLGGLMGLRIGEICLLEPKHFKQPGKLIVPGTKTAASARELPLHPRILEELARETFPLAYPGSPTRNALDRAAARAGIEKHVHPHLLRHTYASLLEWLGCPLDVRARMLGHGKSTVTERYSHAAWQNWLHWQTALVEHVYQPVGSGVGYKASQTQAQ